MAGSAEAYWVAAWAVQVAVGTEAVAKEAAVRVVGWAAVRVAEDQEADRVEGVWAEEAMVGAGAKALEGQAKEEVVVAAVG